MHQRLIDTYRTEAPGHRVTTVIVGRHYVLVRLAGDAIGVVAAPPFAGGAYARTRAGHLAGQDAATLLGLAASEHPVERAVGFATANALASLRDPPFVTGNLADVLPAAPGQRVLTFGYFHSLMPRLQARGLEVRFTELRPVEGPDPVPASELDAVLATSDWVLVTGETLANGTLPGILARLPPAGRLVLLGPSTPLDPALFAGLPVAGLAGVRVLEPDGFCQLIQEGGATPDFGGRVERRIVWR
jgi:hypothetical protein